MAVHLPASLLFAQEPPLVEARQRLPQGRGDRTQTVDDVAPPPAVGVDAGFDPGDERVEGQLRVGTDRGDR